MWSVIFIAISIQISLIIGFVNFDKHHGQFTFAIADSPIVLCILSEMLAHLIYDQNIQCISTESHIAVILPHS